MKKMLFSSVFHAGLRKYDKLYNNKENKYMFKLNQPILWHFLCISPRLQILINFNGKKDQWKFQTFSFTFGGIYVQTLPQVSVCKIEKPKKKTGLKLINHFWKKYSYMNSQHSLHEFNLYTGKVSLVFTS